jgi:hypothetical protein
VLISPLLDQEGKKLQRPNSNFCKQLKKKKIQKVVRPTRSPRQQWPSRRTKNGDLSIVFFSRVGLRTYQHPCIPCELRYILSIQIHLCKEVWINAQLFATSKHTTMPCLVCVVTTVIQQINKLCATEREDSSLSSQKPSIVFHPEPIQSLQRLQSTYLQDVFITIRPTIT